MRLDCVLTATNDDPMYMDFIPIFVDAWKTLYPTTDVKVILIGERIPDKFRHYEKHIILFPHIQGIPSASISQYIRLLYPAILDYEEGILITDMDMLPMNDTYYSEPIKNMDRDAFIHYTHYGVGLDQVGICYNIARNATWAEIFGIRSTKDIEECLELVYKTYGIGTSCIMEQPHLRDCQRVISAVAPRLKQWDHELAYWVTDQLHLYEYLQIWKAKTERIILLPPGEEFGKARLNRGRDDPRNPEVEQKVRFGYYADYHAYRPYQEYKEVNDHVLSLLKASKN